MLPIDLPWRRQPEDDATGADTAGEDPYDDAVVVCEFQDGTIAVFEDEVRIDRASRSRFADKAIPAADITGVEYDGGITVGYLQVEQTGIEPDGASLLSDPVDENTVHFGRGGRDCAREARDAILERMRA